MPPMLRSSSRVAALAALSCASLAGCAQRNQITPGAYTGGAVQLSVDAAKREVVFTQPGIAPVRRAATAWDLARWPNLCPRGTSDTRSEVLDLGAEPLELGTVRVEHPLLVADCVGKPAIDLSGVDASGAVGRGPGLMTFSR